MNLNTEVMDSGSSSGAIEFDELARLMSAIHDTTIGQTSAIPYNHHRPKGLVHNIHLPTPINKSGVYYVLCTMYYVLCSKLW